MARNHNIDGNRIPFTPEEETLADAEEAQAAIDKALWDTQEYARDRKAEYDALNQFELMTDDAANGTTTHADAIEVIKKKYPKG